MLTAQALVQASRTIMSPEHYAKQWLASLSSTERALVAGGAGNDIVGDDELVDGHW